MNNPVVEYDTKTDPNIGCHETHYAAIAHVQEAGGLAALIDMTNGLKGIRGFNTLKINIIIK